MQFVCNSVETFPFFKIPRMSSRFCTSNGSPPPITTCFVSLSARISAIFNKFLELFPDKKPTPELLLKIKEEALISVGLSRQKRSYLFSIAEKFSEKKFNSEFFQNLTDEEVINELIQIKGIGKWSAQMFLMFTLARKDVFAPNDLGLRKAIKINYKLENLPTSKEVETFAEKWKPYRTYASILLWRSLKEE